MSARNKMREFFKDARRKISHNSLKNTAEKARTLKKKRNAAQSTLKYLGFMSKSYLPTNKENHSSTKRNYIQKRVKKLENTKKRINEIKGNGINFNRNAAQIGLSHFAETQKNYDEYERELLKKSEEKDKSPSLESRSKPQFTRPRVRNPSPLQTSSLRTSTPRPRVRSPSPLQTNELRASTPRPRVRNPSASALQTSSLRTSAPRPRVRSRSRSLSRSISSQDKSEPEVVNVKEVKESMNGLNKMVKEQSVPEVVNVKEVRKSMNGLNKMLRSEKKVNPTLLKECEDSYKNLKGDTKRMKFSLEHNKKKHQDSNKELYELLDQKNFSYKFLDHRFENEEQTKYGHYKKSYEDMDEKYKMLVNFYKELKGKCVTNDTEEDCYMMHKILRSEFNIFQIGRDYYNERRDQVNRLIHSIKDIDDLTLDLTVKRHFKDDEQATYAYYRKSYDEVNKTYKKVMEAYNELVTYCEIDPDLKQMIHLQMSELSNGL